MEDAALVAGVASVVVALIERGVVSRMAEGMCRGVNRLIRSLGALIVSLRTFRRRCAICVQRRANQEMEMEEEEFN